MFLPVRILGTAAILPRARVTADDLDARLNLPAGTTLARNGVHTRYFADDTETTSAMSAAAIEQGLRTAGLDAQELDAIIFTGVMSEQPMPCTAVLIHRRLGARIEGVTCFDINASCTGFLKAFETAACGIHSGLWRHVAIVSAELSSKGLNWNDLDTCTLFGDGAAAAILGPAERADEVDGSGVVACSSGTVSEGADLSVMRAGGSRFNIRTPPPNEDDYLFAMTGRGLLRQVQTYFPPFLDRLLATTPDISIVIPHQASAVGLGFLRRYLAGRGTPPIPYVDILAETGNQVSVSLPTALHRAIEDGRLSRGATALLVGSGAGLAMSGIVIRY